MSPSTLGRRAATKAVVATGAVVAMISGGFAMAATGTLPTLPDTSSDRATEALAATRPPSKAPSSTPTASEPDEETADDSTNDSEAAAASPTPSFRGLCTAFQASDKSAHGKALKSAAFTALATRAGGANLVATYCVTLVGKPKETGRPTDKPAPTSGRSTDKPAPGKPTDKPNPTTGRPTDEPAPGRPTDKPTPTKGESAGNKR